MKKLNSAGVQSQKKISSINSSTLPIQILNRHLKCTLWNVKKIWCMGSFLHCYSKWEKNKLGRLLPLIPLHMQHQLMDKKPKQWGGLEREKNVPEKAQYYSYEYRWWGQSSRPVQHQLPSRWKVFSWMWTGGKIKRHFLNGSPYFALCATVGVLVGGWMLLIFLK